jgi:DNA-binding NarL/FixJ family response regulator
MNTIRVLLADDQILFREALHTLLSVQTGIEVIAEAGTGHEAITLALRHRPQVILMDVQMPGLDGVAAARRLKTELPDCRVILLTTFDDDEYVFEGLRAGAIGYLLKDVPAKRLVEAIEAAVRGETFLHPSITAKIVAEVTRQTQPAAPPLVEPLTAREIEILRLMAKGQNNREIAETLVITEGTVKNHITNILGKLEVRDRTQAILKAQSLHLV